MNIIGKKISETRKIKGLTQEKLAELSKVNLRTIQRIENNENEPRGKTLSLICETLDIDASELIIQNDKNINNYTIGERIVNIVFLLILNLVLMSIFGFLTIDSNANSNSLAGAFFLSFFIPFFITYYTRKMTGIERMIKFGTGFTIYIVLMFFKFGIQGIVKGGLVPCLIIALGVLYFGEYFMKRNQTD